MFIQVVKKGRKRCYMLLNCKKVKFLSSGDEQHFFSRIESLNGVIKVYGKGFSIIIEVEDSIDDLCLKELIAIFYRYNADMSQLKSFLTRENKFWFYSNSRAYWHRKVFRKRK